MTPQAQRGRRLFLILASLIVLLKSIAIMMALSHGLENLNWRDKILTPAGFAMCVMFMWGGENWMRWTMALVCIYLGCFGVYLCIRGPITLDLSTSQATEWRYFQFAWPYYLRYGLVAAFYLTVGLLFSFSPSLNAFFKYQRERHLFISRFL